MLVLQRIKFKSIVIKSSCSIKIHHKNQNISSSMITWHNHQLRWSILWYNRSVIELKRLKLSKRINRKDSTNFIAFCSYFYPQIHIFFSNIWWLWGKVSNPRANLLQYSTRNSTMDLQKNDLLPKSLLCNISQDHRIGPKIQTTEEHTYRTSGLL